jgi:HEAT repeat protein
MKINVKFVSLAILAIAAGVFAMDGRKASKNDKLFSPRDHAIEIIKEAASDRNPLIRLGAIEAIVICRCGELYPLIEQGLADDVDAVRFGAALAVGDLGYGKAAGKVSDMFESSDQNEKIAAAYALLKLGDNDMDYHKAIVSALQSSDDTLSANAALIMGKLRAKKYIGLLRWAFQNKQGQEKTQIQAIESLAMLGYTDIASKAWALMISKRADDRVMGVITMYHLNTYDARNAIKTMLEDDILEVRLIAAGRLEALNSSDGREVITQFFEEDVKKLSGEDRARALTHAIDAIRFSKNLRLSEYLPGYLNDENIAVRLHSAIAILCIS